MRLSYIYEEENITESKASYEAFIFKMLLLALPQYKEL